MAAPYSFGRLIIFFSLASLGCLSHHRDGRIHLSSFVDDLPRYERMIEQRMIFQSSLSRVKGGIVSHHLLAGRAIAGFFSTAREAARSPQGRIIIIGPNHASRGNALTAASVREWKTPFGVCIPDREFIKRLVREGVVSIDEDAFLFEHSIGSLLPFVRHYFPLRRVVPILVNYRLSWDDAARLGAVLARTSDENDLVVLSADFVHNRTVREARAIDERSRGIIQSFYMGCTAEYVSRVEMDCRKGLLALCTFLRESGATDADILLNTNGGEMFGGRGPVTSYFFALYGTR